MALFGKAVQIGIDVEGGSEVFYPGDALSGIIRLEAKKKVKFEEIRLELNSIEKFKVRVEQVDIDDEGFEMTSTHSKTETSKVNWAKVALLPGGELAKGFKQEFPIEIAIPDGVYSTHKGGSLASFDWELRVVVDRKMAVDVNEEVEIIIGALVSEEWFEPAEVGESNEPDEADMCFVLPKQAWLLGETVSGELRVNPKNDFKVSEVRVELERYEYSPLDPNDVMGTFSYTYDETALSEEYTKTVVKESLSGKIKYATDEEHKYSFEFAMPTEAPLSGGTPNSACNWSLKGVLNRTMRKDTVVTVVVQVVN